DVPGRPALYATTPEFLAYFGLDSLADLPPLTDAESLAALFSHRSTIETNPPQS
ncbi:MAG: SMC-Scp complex subunit ScpB, partial [Shewanella sp.]